MEIHFSISIELGLRPDDMYTAWKPEYTCTYQQNDQFVSLKLKVCSFCLKHANSQNVHSAIQYSFSGIWLSREI